LLFGGMAAIEAPIPRYVNRSRVFSTSRGSAARQKYSMCYQ
jgi:hypothetical protein